MSAAIKSLLDIKNGQYKLGYELQNDTIRFTIDAQTTGWVSFGASTVLASGQALGFHKQMDTYIGFVFRSLAFSFFCRL